MTFHHTTLRKILDARGISPRSIATVSGMSVNKLESTLQGDNLPTKNQIVKLAERLAVPPHAFFMENYEIKSTPIVDFRASKPESLKYGRDASKFEYIFKLRNFLSDLYLRMDLHPPQELYASDPDENPEQFARSVENYLNLRVIRKNANDKSDFYQKFRDRVEDLGIFIIQDHNIDASIDGFALYHDKFTSNLIFVNSLKRNQAAKSFTIAHELAHIFGKRSAISNNYQYDNVVEAYANEFAASLLLPREELINEIEEKKYMFIDYNTTKYSAQKISETFKCSVSAVFIRLEKLGITKSEHTRRFLSGFGKGNFADSEKPQKFGSKAGPKPGVIDKAFLGSRATRIIVQALKGGFTSKYEIFDNTGLPKKRIDGLVTVFENLEQA